MKGLLCLNCLLLLFTWWWKTPGCGSESASENRRMDKECWRHPSIIPVLCCNHCNHRVGTFIVLLLNCPEKCPQISTHSVLCALSLRPAPFHTRARRDENPVSCPLLAVNNGQTLFPKWQGIGLNMLRCVGTGGLRAYLLQIKTDVDAQINSCSCCASF